MMKHTQILALLFILLLLLPGSSFALKSDFSKAIDVQADSSEFDERSGIQILRGNVVITQGTLQINADKISVSVSRGKLETIHGVGSPILFQQENEEGELVLGECDKIEYDASRGNLVLIGNATLKQPNQELTGERIEFDSKTQTVRADGGDQGRVSIKIQPPPSAEPQP